MDNKDVNAVPYSADSGL